MPELRWILLAAGILLVAGLWWWETHRDRDKGTAPDAAEAADEPPGAEAATGPDWTEPHLSGDDADTDEGEEDDTDGLPPIRATRRERGSAMRDPPIVDIPGDVEPELARPSRRSVAPQVSYREMQDRLGDLPEDLKRTPRGAAAEAEQRLPWVRTQPLDREELMGGNRATAAEQATEAAPQAEPQDEQQHPASRQRIVALRLIAPAGRWPGRKLIEALEAEGLVYGKYSIYHREREDGKTVFYVASMVEPGSFDLAAVDKLDYPGVSVFAVVPGPVDAPTAFDMMLGTARKLCERLNGRLQDELGSTLTAQRILSLREELVHLEHVAQRLHKR